MPKLCVPSVGDKIRLTREWEFPLHFEHRNSSLIHRIRPGLEFGWRDKGSIIATLEKGTVLRVDRIYIRKGKGEWDSITFIINEAPKDDKRAKATKQPSRWNTQANANGTEDKGQQPEQKYKGARFWAKLDDVNEIYFEKVEEPVEA